MREDVPARSRPDGNHSGDNSDTGPPAKRPRLGQTPSHRLRFSHRRSPRAHASHHFQLPQLETLVQDIDSDQGFDFGDTAQDAGIETHVKLHLGLKAMSSRFKLLVSCRIPM